MTVRQTLYFVTGVGLMFAALRPSYQKIGRYAYPAFAITLVLLVLLVLDRYINLPLIPVINGSRRWISLGPLSLQPSEFMKVVLILTLARYLRFRSSYRRWRGLIPPFLLTLLPMGLILQQPDLGTTLMLLPVLFIMLFVAGARLRHLTMIVLLGCATLPAFYVYGMKDYQRERFQILFKQNVEDVRWQMGPGYQLRQSKTALGSGGLTGEGWGQGVFIEKSLVPEEHNDFIFAIIGHQWGLVGCAGHPGLQHHRVPGARGRAGDQRPVRAAAGGRRGRDDRRAGPAQYKHDHRARADHRHDAALRQRRRE